MTEREFITRAAAIEQGIKRYFTGKPCKHGHIDWRFTRSGRCVACHNIGQRNWHSRNKKLRNHQNKVWYENNKKRKLLNDKKWHRENREREAASEKKWRAENLDRVRFSRHKRRAIIKSSCDPNLTSDNFRGWLNRQEKVCYWCKKRCKNSFHIDHYIPLSRGGLHSLENLVIACPSCNLRKSARDPYEFASQMGRLF